MKKKYLFSLAMAGLLLGACNSDDVVVPTGEGQGPQWDANGNGYVSLAINLPTKSAATKAFNEGSNLDDGTPEEYDVKNATLILFKGTDEEEATVVNAYSLPLKWGAGNPNQITTTAKIVQKINSISMGNGEKLYALVVLNHNDVFEVTSNAGLQVKDDADVFTGTLDALNLKVAANEATGDWHKNGFLMANAPLANKAGGLIAVEPVAVETLTLTEIDPTKIKESYNAAEVNPAANIFVERAVAKVTLKNTGTGILTESDLMPATQKKYKILGWDIDNTNTKSNLVRNVGKADWVAYKSNATTGTPGYRFLGGTIVGATIPVAGGNSFDLYRTYWGEDVNYNEDASGLVTQGSDTISSEMLKAADGVVPDYCLENTTDMDRMLEKNCTRVIVKALFNNGEDFYILNDDRSKIWEEETVKKEVLKQFMESPNGIEWLNKNIKPVETGETVNVAKDTDFNVTFTSTISGVGVQSVSIALKDDPDVKDKYNDGADPSECNEYVNNRIKIDLYKNGVAYYPVYIKHFGDDETPWNGTESGKPEVGSIYPGGARNYLGRYGVLRNNWYDIDVTGIKNIGSSTVDPVEGETIDKLESYISVRINILAWAKRSQSVEL